MNGGFTHLRRPYLGREHTVIIHIHASDEHDNGDDEHDNGDDEDDNGDDEDDDGGKKKYTKKTRKPLVASYDMPGIQ